ncbi:Thyroglobulin type-1 repeat family protein [Brugia malayi]|uniref:Bm5549, isoform b n=3 Tax=Brugia malayi TaxID=6279 RepID=A0A0R3RES9_BRUMA|nr:Thyroglobulin type-1 repeat family protein [Brugia malayi]CDP98422.2 Bm5549, isoform b [Brugia malayi]VIO98996.1 Thyroglobulin type-1 repeat family protein [Brugia malayi]
MSICLLLIHFFIGLGSTYTNAFALTTIAQLRSERSQGEEECFMQKLCNYEEMNVEPICGSDGRTYNSYCEVKRAICHGNPVKKQFSGPCPENLRCQLERAYQLKLAAEKMNSSEVYVPECNATDGSYATIQCHKSTGYCWCVTRIGRPLPSTSKRYGIPNCHILQKTKIGRRSHRKSNGDSVSLNVCTTVDRSTFNANLLNIFKKEYERSEQFLHHTNGAMQSFDKKILLWKFGQLDSDKNSRLNSKEFGGLRRLVRKHVTPKTCARKFTKYCDLNKDGEISAREWVTCLGIDISTSYNMFNALRPNSSITNSNNSKSNNNNNNTSMVIKDDHHKEQQQQQQSIRKQEIQGIVHADGIIGMPIVDSRRKNETELKREQDEDERNEVKEDTFGKTDCRTQRERAMRKLENNPENGNYIPTCAGDTDILFDRIQCHRLSHICWCVNPKTGIPQSGTSKYNAKPNCDGTLQQNDLSRRQIKGCSGRKKTKFYQRLFSSLISEWILALGDEANDDAITSKDKAVRWKFEQLDVNNNSRLERKEWKSYRNELRLLNKVRKCGRNFLRFCDRDGNKQIRLDEWLNCTIYVDMTVSSMPVAKLRVTPRKNPFLDILQPDD